MAPDEPVVLLGPAGALRQPGGPQARGRADPLRRPVAGRRALDAGASTGGFTDCLLQRGASHVYAVDVGHGQLHPSLRARPAGHRPRAGATCGTLTRTGSRRPTPRFEPCTLVVADLSFISLRGVVPALSGPVAAPGADLVLLVKPQFEVGRAAVSRGKGVVRDPALWQGALDGVASALDAAGTGIMGAMRLPPDRPGRQRRVPAARPQGRARARAADRRPGRRCIGRRGRRGGPGQSQPTGPAR